MEFAAASCPCGSEELPGESFGLLAVEDGLRSEIAELRDALLRARADHDNYRKRVERERTESAGRGCEELLVEILPILDNFELGLRTAPKDVGASVLGGFSMIFEQLRKLLQSRGVVAIGVAGELFDPHCEEAIAMVPHDSIAGDHVVDVVRRGYRWESRLLRPATVIVSRGPSRPEGEGVFPGAEGVSEETEGGGDSSPSEN